MVVVVASALGYWKLRGSKGTDFGATDEVRPPTALVCVTNIHFAISAAGDIGPADQVSVRPEINGKVMTLPVDIGDNVPKGATLFTLDDKDLQTSRSSRMTEIDGAKLQLDRAKRNYDRSVQLYDDKLISLELFENTKTEFELAKNALEMAQKDLNVIEDQLTKTKIPAPFDCTVLTRPVSIGQAVSGSGGYNSGTEVLTIANLNEMIVNAHINQADVTRMKMGQAVDMEVEAVAGLKMQGTIERIAPQATVRNGIKGFATRILLTNLDAQVRPGMTANISIPVASVENVPTVPLGAVFSEMGERYVWVVKAGDNGFHYERRPVKIGVSDYALVEIQSGLAPGDEVALEQPPAKVLEAMDKETDKKGPGSSLSNKPPSVASATNSTQVQTNVMAAGSAATPKTVKQ